MYQNKLYSTTQVAEMLGVTRTAVLGYIARNRLIATRQGRDYQIHHRDFERFAKTPRKPGFPKGKKRNRRALTDDEITRNLVRRAVQSLVDAKLFCLSEPTTNQSIERALEHLMSIVNGMERGVIDKAIKN